MRVILIIAYMLFLSSACYAESYQKKFNKLEISYQKTQTFDMSQLQQLKSDYEDRISELQAQLDITNDRITEAENLGVQ